MLDIYIVYCIYSIYSIYFIYYLREFAPRKRASSWLKRVGEVISQTRTTPSEAKGRQTKPREIEFPRSIWGTEAGFVKKKSLGAHSERNVKKQVAYVLRFRDPKSLGAHSGDRSICVFAYLTVLLGGHFPILQYLIALLEGHFLCFGFGCLNRWQP